MQFIIINILSILLFSFSLNPNNIKHCINCKFFIDDNDTGKFGKCSLFPRISKDNYFLVNGVINLKSNDFIYCSVAREYENMCGINGKMHKRKYTKKIQK
jgi:hypothetical protein